MKSGTDLVYLDTSIVVPLLVPESRSAAISRWLGSTPARLVASSWLELETAAALGRVGRMRLLDPTAVAQLWLQAGRLFAGGLTLLHVEPSVLARAAEWCRDPALGLRAGDAIHLASAIELVVSEVATADADMAAIARRLGLTVRLFA